MNLKKIKLKFTSDHCELEGKIMLRYACELDLDLFFKFIKISELICELKISFDLLYNSGPNQVLVFGYVARSMKVKIFFSFSKVVHSEGRWSRRKELKVTLSSPYEGVIHKPSKKINDFFPGRTKIKSA